MRRVALIVFLVLALCTCVSASVPPNLVARRVEKRIFRDGTFALETLVPPGPGSTYKREHSVIKGGKNKRDVFMYPGTNWCGAGATADRYNQLGYNSAADRCCRQHDSCSHIIPGMRTRYHLFNYRLHSISHCQCDERFRTCLKMLNSAASNMVGKVFFNVVQMRCFVLKAEKVCARRSWWGKCEKYEMKKSAHMRDALSY